MRVTIITFGTFLLANAVFADDDASRAKLIGRWLQSDGNAEAKCTWALEGAAADSIHVTTATGAQTVAEFDCNTLGKECTVKDGGRKSKVSMWFNGPKLVELETKGAVVVKRRFAVTGEGDTMELETIPIAPAGKPEISRFKRAQAVAAKQ